ncbi:MAG: permease [Clostridiales bacterium]|nr:permease [Clostridiales bacterium]
MKLIKKNKILIVAIIAYILVALFKPSYFVEGLIQSKYYFIEMLQILPAVFILTSLIQTWVPTPVIMKYFGDGSGIKGYGLSFLIGSLSAGPIYAAFPVCKTLFKKGAGIKNIMIILSTWAVVKIPMLINEAKFMGVEYMVVRWALTVVAIMIMAMIVGRFLKPSDIKMTIGNIVIDDSVCILCERCLNDYPDVIIKTDKGFAIRDGKEVSEEILNVCPVGAIG